jgi:Divergent InlB B-repeat domain
MMNRPHRFLLTSTVLLAACGGGPGGPGNGLPPQPFEVAIEGLGAGTVRADSGGFECGAGLCTVPSPASSTVTLTATPAAGATFAGWGGDCSGTGPCTLDLSYGRKVQAAFTLPGLRSTVLGTPGQDLVRGLTADPAGNVTVAARSTDGGNIEGQPVPANQNYLARYAASGELRWLRSLPAEVGKVAGLAIDSSGRTLITATFSETVDLGTGGALTSAGGTDILLALYDGDGKPVWARRFGGTSADAARAVAIAPNGDIHLSGDTGSAGIDFGSGPVGFITRGFTARLSSSGEPLLAQDFQGVQAFAFDSRGRTLLTGHVESSSGGFFVICLAADGSEVWSTGPESGSYGYSAGVGLAVDGNDNVYVTGNFAGSFRSVPGLAPGAEDAFLMKLTPDGNTVWSKALGGGNGDFASALVLDREGNLVLAGRSSSSILDLGGGNLMTRPNRGQQAFLARFSPTGDHLWSRVLGGEGADDAILLAHPASGPVLLAGTFEKSVHFGDAERQSLGFQDAFFVSLP